VKEAVKCVVKRTVKVRSLYLERVKYLTSETLSFAVRVALTSGCHTW